MDQLDGMYQQMIVNIGDRYQKSANFLETVMDKIAYHESRRDPACKQIGGGPGRGLYQFEKGPKEGVDATNVPKLGQDMMFLANVRYHHKASFKGLIMKDLPIWWAKYHWAGPEHQAEARIKAFNSSMHYYPGPVL